MHLRVVGIDLLGSNAVWTCWLAPTFRWNILPSSSGILRINSV